MSGDWFVTFRRCWQTLLSRRRLPARVAKLTVLLLTGLLLVAVTPGGSTAVSRMRLVAAGSSDATAQISIDITTITPLSPGPKDTLRITGRVRSRGGASVTGVQISLHLGSSVSSRAELHGLRAQPVPQQIATPQEDVGDGKLNPGSALPFTLSTPIAKLQLPGPGVYPMQITAIGIEDGSYRDLATDSTFLPYVPAAQATPQTPLAWLVPLTADPAVLADGTLDADSGPPAVAAVSANGRLRRLLDALSASRAATATVDPALIQTLTLVSSDRYAVSQVNSAPSLHPADRSAGQWLNDLRAANTVQLIGLPYADADIEALLHGNQLGLADDARQRGSVVLALGLQRAASRVTSAVGVPPGGEVDSTGAGYYSSTANAQGLVVNADAVPATGDNPSATATVPGVRPRLLLADAVLTQLATANPGSSPRLAEQDIVAELAEAHLEDRLSATPTEGSASNSAQPLLIAPPPGWDPPGNWATRLLADTGQLPWLKQVPVTSLLSASAEPRASLLYPPSAAAAQIPLGTVQSSAEISAATGGLFRQPVRGDPPQPRTPDSIVRPIRDAALAAVSSRFRSNPAQSDVFLQSAQSTFTQLQQQVRVVASRQVTLTSRTGRVPVTLENDLAAAVDVQLELTSLDRSRVSSGTVLRRTVRAGQKVQVEVEVKAASAGTFPVRLALFTPDRQPLGVPVQVLVRSTTYGVVAIIFTIVALSILGLAVLFRAVRALVRQSRRRSTPAGTP